MLDKNAQLTRQLFLDKWRKIGLSTEEADRPTAEWAMRWIYNQKGYFPQPRIQWVQSPREITETVTKLGLTITPNSTKIEEARNGDFVEMIRVLLDNISLPLLMEAAQGQEVFQQLRAMKRNTMFMDGQFFAGNVGYQDYLANAKNEEISVETYGYINLAISAGVVLAMKDVCYISERPSSILLDEENRLHGLDVPAMIFRDGFEVWAWHGLLVGKDVITKQFTWEEIHLQNNVEIRRVMMEIYGQSNFLMDANAEEVSIDGYGTLYRLDIKYGEDLVMVKVVNTTPEPDGSYKDYFLRVPPQIETAEQAVAWTFDMEEGAYAPLKES